MAKDYDKKGYWGKRNAEGEMADHYGIDKSEYYMEPNVDRYGYSDKKTYEQYQADLGKAISNDYDLRRSIEAASLAGNKKAQKIQKKGFGHDDKDILAKGWDATKFLEKTHKNRMGQGGQFTARDQDDVTKFWIDRDRKKEAQRFSDEYVAKTELDDIRRDIEENVRDAEAVVAPELSEELDEANRGIDQYSLELNTHGDNIFGSAGGSDLDTAMAENERNPASGESWEYKDKYASNVKQGIKLSGINTRGPHSIVAAKEVLRRTV